MVIYFVLKLLLQHNKKKCMPHTFHMDTLVNNGHKYIRICPFARTHTAQSVCLKRRKKSVSVSVYASSRARICTQFLYCNLLLILALLLDPSINTIFNLTDMWCTKSKLKCVRARVYLGVFTILQKLSQPYTVGSMYARVHIENSDETKHFYFFFNSNYFINQINCINLYDNRNPHSIIIFILTI